MFPIPEVSLSKESKTEIAYWKFGLEVTKDRRLLPIQPLLSLQHACDYELFVIMETLSDVIHIHAPTTIVAVK